MADAKVQIGNSADFLEGTSVDTPAGNNLFREGVVVSDPADPQARANIRPLSLDLQSTDMGIVTHSVIQGFSTSGGGGFHDVKVTPSGALTVEAQIVEPVSITGTVNIAEPVTVDGTVALDVATLEALENVNATVSGSVSVSNFPTTQQVSGTVALDSASLAALEQVTVSATDLDIRNLSSAQDNVRAFDSTDSEYLRVATSVNAAGDTTLVTPTSGKRIRLHWVYAINDPAASTSTKITIKLGSDVQYVAWAISKRQQLTGAVDGALIVNLSNAGDVAVTIFYEEVD